MKDLPQWILAQHFQGRDFDALSPEERDLFVLLAMDRLLEGAVIVPEKEMN